MPMIARSSYKFLIHKGPNVFNKSNFQGQNINVIGLDWRYSFERGRGAVLLSLLLCLVGLVSVLTLVLECWEKVFIILYSLNG